MKLLHILTIAALAPACAQMDAGEDSGEPGGDTGDTGDTGTSTPNIEVLLTDAPGDFDEVWVDITAVEIHSSEAGWMPLVEEPQSFDLLTLQDDVTAALGDATLAPGHYGQLRMIVEDASVVSEGESESLKIASGAQTGIKMNLDADIEDGMVYTLVIDFDAAKSVKKTGQGWLMTPVVFVKAFTGVPLPEDDGEGDGDDDGDDNADGSDDDDGGSDDDGGDGDDEIPVD